MKKSFLAFCLISLVMIGCAVKTVNPIKSDYSNSKLVDGKLSYTVNPGWQRVPVSSPLRVDQIIIDPVTQTELNVFFFEGMTNAVEANLSRWKAQFKPETRKLVENKQFNLGKIPITIFSMTGTYLRPLEQLNPDSPKEELNDYAMYAIIAELKSGTWFFKAYGPEPVIMSQVSNFERFVTSFKVAP
jgi:hypothetical protein